MIITCGQCQAKFKVAPEQIKVTGSKVRCSNCRHVFTVYRPGREEESPPAGPPGAAAAVESGPGPGDDFFSEEPAADDDDFETDGDFAGDDDLEEEELEEEEEARSARERREQRRRLYADLEERREPDEEEAEDDDLSDPDLDEASGHPPLRRGRRPAAGAAPAGEEQEEEQEEEENDDGDDGLEYDDDENQADESQASAAPAAEIDDALGLAADPAQPAAGQTRRLLVDAGDLPPAGGLAGLGGVSEARAAVTRVKGRRSGLLLVAAIFCAALAIGIYYLSARPEPLALSDGADPDQIPPLQATDQAPAVASDPNGTENITFTPKDNLKHFYRDRAAAQEGRILIITGRVRNSYPEARSFIRLRGTLYDQAGNALADRYVYAGNTVSEEDLKKLPMSEILTRLNIKGGLNNQNMNIPPGQEVPFMVVFDKLPPNGDEYRIVPVGSNPAE